MTTGPLVPPHAVRRGDRSARSDLLAPTGYGRPPPGPPAAVRPADRLRPIGGAVSHRALPATHRLHSLSEGGAVPGNLRPTPTATCSPRGDDGTHPLLHREQVHHSPRHPDARACSGAECAGGWSLHLRANRQSLVQQAPAPRSLPCPAPTPQG